jgi:hypothetical protein
MVAPVRREEFGEPAIDSLGQSPLGHKQPSRMDVAPGRRGIVGTNATRVPKLGFSVSGKIPTGSAWLCPMPPWLGGHAFL